ncbi:Holliday junction resolvasome, DNA binding subunit [Elusimicrobium minutum Pei191]|uniref:Holliday junction branch migration complex subunit RuvA n=1 Tax=Elusimicrobium minutum (strain Pei191) TaxID=445932 RepID=RUVA_ELUMP|nr:Holliday junction branch migration protein RuvA [Elusimicrobium minutum]B2KCD9.1 RecName: Full=Holliday junction branch migration complex subunit RuvA [Elusimicrobium minutum Pei191]ACC98060.1 Holliday junction resolvasome, DNA binding subunit [Elusimicrobium minutum Pei191]
MIGYLKGQILSLSEDSVLILVNGVGYEVNCAPVAVSALEEGQETALYIAESISPYDGTVLYGFLTKEDKQLWAIFKTSIPNTGAKKALEYLNKALRSVADFHNAIVKKDPKILTGIFGFTAKTAEKLIHSLDGKMDAVTIAGVPKIKIEGEAPFMSEVMMALTALGYSPMEARKAIDQLYKTGLANDSVENIIRAALRILKK